VTGLILIVVLFVLFWLVLLRPQRRRQAEQRELLTSLEPGDEIVSTGGLFGMIRSIDGDELHVEIAEGLVVRMARRAVAGLVERDEAPEPVEITTHEDGEPVETEDETAKPS
jgi:preprotein translocase subunit YajC